jgi:hypothetical protein
MTLLYQKQVAAQILGGYILKCGRKPGKLAIQLIIFMLFQKSQYQPRSLSWDWV